MTNQQKLQAIFDLTGGPLFEEILQTVGNETVYFPQTYHSARRKPRDIGIRAEFYSDKYSGMKSQEIYRILGIKYGLSPDRIRKIVNQNTSGSR